MSTTTSTSTSPLEGSRADVDLAWRSRGARGREPPLAKLRPVLGGRDACKPARERLVERRHVGEPEQERDLSDRERAVGEVALGQLASHVVEQLAVARALFAESPVQRGKAQADLTGQRLAGQRAGAQLLDE